LRIRLANRAGPAYDRGVAAALIGLALATAGPVAAAPDSRDRNAHPGLVASVGVGASYVAYGAALAYLQPLGDRWTVSAGAGFGRLGAGSDDALYLEGHAPHPWGATFALGASFGRRHRLCADLGYGAQLSQEIAIEGLVIDAVARYGLFTEVGYEFLDRSGVFVRILPFGLGYVPNPLVESSQRFSWQGSVGLGWKLW
jgi:hypothetical protein